MDKTLAALTFFTRLPLWRLREIPPGAYEKVVDLWPLAGWLTGGLSAVVYLAVAYILPLPIAAALAITSRILLTGGLHEDGLADFFDGFGGGGSDRARILAIMKDSRTGSYGVIATALYLIILTTTISSFPPLTGAVAIMASDAWSKAVSGLLIINTLPYARTAETSKNRLVYRRMSLGAGILCFLFGAMPMLPFAFITPQLIFSGVAPVLTVSLGVIFLRRRLGGYTGDCCGATALISELMMLLAASALQNM